MNKLAKDRSYIKKLNILPLSECIEKVLDCRGQTPKKLDGCWSNSGIKALSAKNIKDGTIVNENSIKFVSEELYRKWMKDEVRQGDILLTSEGPLGECLLWDSGEKIVLSQRLFGIRPKRKIVISKYLYYYFRSPFYQHELLSRATGTTVKGIRQSELLKTKVLIPPLNQQKQIASILSSLDDKIELNRRMNKTLEEIGKAIFKHWFIDFEFPWDFEENQFSLTGKPYKSSGGKMVESELGKIPKGWKIRKLIECVEINKGLSYKGKNLAEGGENILVSLKCFKRGGGFNLDGIKYYDGDYKEEHLLNEGDLIVAMTDLTQAADVIGMPALVPKIPNAKKIIASLDVAIIKPINSELGQEFLYFLFLTSTTRDFLWGYVNGSTVLHLNIQGLRELKIIYPPETIMMAFNSLIKPLFRKIKNNENQIAKLSQIRDSLLPRLMSGRLKLCQN